MRLNKHRLYAGTFGALLCTLAVMAQQAPNGIAEIQKQEAERLDINAATFWNNRERCLASMPPSRQKSWQRGPIADEVTSSRKEL